MRENGKNVERGEGKERKAGGLKISLLIKKEKHNKESSEVK